MALPQDESCVADVDEKPLESKPPPSFGDVATRIRSRTTDLLAIAVIAIGGITIGTRVSGWFNADESPPPTKAVVNSVGGPGAAMGNESLTLDFGRLPVRMHRSNLKGDRKAAVDELLRRCRELGTSSQLPGPAASSAERRLLAKLAEQKPVEESSDGARLYRFDGPVTMASFTRPEKPRVHGAGADANSARRVVCWGLAYPAGERRWTVSIFTPTEQASAAGSLPQIPLPTNARQSTLR